MHWKQFFTPVKSLDAEEAKAFMEAHKEGTYTLLDVRQPGEYEKERIPGARLVPLPDLPNRIRELDPKKPVIAY
ncbi:MAG: rhodanese-like domain-containing protein [Deltaproteobacteria bacterium]|nr:rhodanese-like domain-containing protein [Deltaproteobacteria bacterium]